MESFVACSFSEKRTEQLIDLKGIADGFWEVNISYLQKYHAKINL